MSSRLLPGARVIPPSLNGLSALELFRAGFDTIDLAAHFNIDEDEALKLVCKQRSAFLGRSNPYANSRPASAESPPWPVGRVAYAGRV